MQNKKVSIQVASLTNMWNFRNELKLHAYSINTGERIITFECEQDKELGVFIEKYKGQLVNMQNA